MIGTKYTPGLLAAFAKSPRLCRMDVKVESVVLPADSVVEWLHTKSNVFISFYENATSDDPWLRICEPA